MRGNLNRLLRRFAPRNDNLPRCHCEASRKGSRGNLVFQKGSISEANPFKKEIATPECLRIQARNDKKGEVALLLAMTISLAVIARLPEREAVAISYSKKEVLAKPILLKRRLPRLNAYAFRLAMTKRAKSLCSSQ